MTLRWSNIFSPTQSRRRLSLWWYQRWWSARWSSTAGRWRSPWAPFLAIAGLQPLLARSRIDRLGSRAREALGDLNAHALDTVQGLGEVVAFEQEGERGREFAGKTAHYVELRLPFFRDLTVQTVLQEVAASLGGLAVVVAGAGLVAAGELTSGILPLLTILAMSAFLPISEIAQVGRQLADTLGATRRVYAVHDEEVPVRSGAGVAGGEDEQAPVLALAFEDVDLLVSRPDYAGAGKRFARGAGPAERWRWSDRPVPARPPSPI